MALETVMVVGKRKSRSARSLSKGHAQEGHLAPSLTVSTRLVCGPVQMASLWQERAPLCSLFLDHQAATRSALFTAKRELPRTLCPMAMVATSALLATNAMEAGVEVVHAQEECFQEVGPADSMKGKVVRLLAVATEWLEHLAGTLAEGWVAPARAAWVTMPGEEVLVRIARPAGATMAAEEWLAIPGEAWAVTVDGAVARAAPVAVVVSSAQLVLAAKWDQQVGVAKEVAWEMHGALAMAEAAAATAAAKVRHGVVAVAMAAETMHGALAMAEMEAMGAELHGEAQVAHPRVSLAGEAAKDGKLNCVVDAGGNASRLSGWQSYCQLRRLFNNITLQGDALRLKPITILSFNPGFVGFTPCALRESATLDA